ncbi:hypothetical protein STEG23_000747 [Scotinomys teguina]
MGCVCLLLDAKQTQEPMIRVTAPMTAALRTESRMCRLSWFLDPGGWSKTAAVGLYFIFPGICTLSLNSTKKTLNDFINISLFRLQTVSGNSDDFRFSDTKDKDDEWSLGSCECVKLYK